VIGLVDIVLDDQYNAALVVLSYCGHGYSVISTSRLNVPRIRLRWMLSIPRMAQALHRFSLVLPALSPLCPTAWSIPRSIFCWIVVLRCLHGMIQLRLIMRSQWLLFPRSRRSLS